jgi:hypothetical protein
MLTPSVVKTRSIKFSTKNLIKVYLEINNEIKVFLNVITKLQIINDPILLGNLQANFWK